MKNIAIFGASGIGREMQAIIEHINSVKPAWNFVGFFDDNLEKGTLINGAKVLGGTDELNQYTDAISIVIGAGKPSIKKQIVEKIKNPKVDYPVLIHPDAHIGSLQHTHILEGTVIAAGTIINVNTAIGKHAFINCGAILGHDVKIGNYAAVMPAVSINGEAVISDGAYIGTGAIITDRSNIGENTVIAAGAVVFGAIRANCTALGYPAKPIMDNT